MNGQIGIIWLDAHTDINTPDTTPSGNVHGMPLAALLGHGAPRIYARCRICTESFAGKYRNLGARSVDPGEIELIRKLGIRVFTMSEIDERGIGTVIQEAIQIATQNTVGFMQLWIWIFWIHFMHRCWYPRNGRGYISRNSSCNGENLRFQEKCFRLKLPK